MLETAEEWQAWAEMSHKFSYCRIHLGPHKDSRERHPGQPVTVRPKEPISHMPTQLHLFLFQSYFFASGLGGSLHRTLQP